MYFILQLRLSDLFSLLQEQNKFSIEFCWIYAEKTYALHWSSGRYEYEGRQQEEKEI